MCVDGNVIIASIDNSFIGRTLPLLSQLEYGYEVVHDCDSAISRLASGAYSLVIIDLDLPGNENMELAYKIQGNYDFLPIVVVTDSYKQDVAIELVELNIAAFIKKSFNDSQFIRILENTMNSFRQHQMLYKNIYVLYDWSSDLSSLIKHDFNKANPAITSRYFSTISMNHIIRCLNSINEMISIMQPDHVRPELCNINECQRLKMLSQVLIEAVKVIDGTRGSFKSKELGNLKKKLLDVLAETIGWETESEREKSY